MVVANGEGVHILVLMKLLGLHMTSCEIASFVTAVGCVLFDCVEDEDLPLLAAVFTQLGAVIDTMVEQKNACEEREKKIEEKKAEEKKAEEKKAEEKKAEEKKAAEKKETEKKGTKGNK